MKSPSLRPLTSLGLMICAGTALVLAACGSAGAPPSGGVGSTSSASGSGGASATSTSGTGGAAGGGGDASSVGPCSADPGSGTQLLAEGHWFPMIALDSQRIYWAQQGLLGEDGTPSVLDAIPLSCAAPSGSALGMAPIGGLASDGVQVYWTSPGQPGKASGALRALPVTGGASVTILAGLDSPGRLIIDADSAFWIDETDGAIRSAPLAGGPVTLLATAAAPLPAPRWRSGSLAIDATHVYWIDAGAGTLRRVPRAGGAAVDLVSDEPRAFAVAVSPAGLFWLRDSSASGGGLAPDGALLRAPLVGGPKVELATGITGPNGLAADASHVYFTARGVFVGGGGNGTVQRVPVLGGAPELLFTGGKAPDAIALDDHAVYWTDRDAQHLYRRAK